MSYRTWLLIAVLGLVPHPLVSQEPTAIENQPRQESGGTDGQPRPSDGQPRPSQDGAGVVDPTPALQDIESAIRDLVSRVDEDERRQEVERSLRNLNAQENMVWWAEMMFYASAASVILTLFALIAIVRTLTHTRRAADAAVGMLDEAATATQAAQRPGLPPGDPKVPHARSAR